jgi:hypothetical protein
MLRIEREAQFGKFEEIVKSTTKSLMLDREFQGNLRATEMYEAGIEYSALLIGFVLYVMEQAIKYDHDKVFFFTREGEFFKKIYDLLALQKPFGVPAPESELLEVSRIATFAPSLGQVSLQTLMRLWSLYSTQSLGAMFSSLDVRSSEFQVFLERYGLSLAEDIRYPWLDSRVQALFNNEQFLDKLNMQVGAKRADLVGYLEQKKFPMRGQAAIVDIGWRGTIQDNLAHLLPGVNIDGFYLGIDKYINQQPVNTRKFGFGPNSNRSDCDESHLFAKVSPIEMLCNSPNGSVVNYVNVGGQYSASRLVEHSENTAYYSSVYFFQKGVEHAAVVLGEVIRRHAVTSLALKEIAMKNWLDICLKPPLVIAEAYFSLSHNESFGLGRFEDKTALIPTRIWIRGFTSIKGFKFLVASLEGTGWPEGYLAKRGLGWFWHFVKFARSCNDKLRRLHHGITLKD